MADWPYTLSRSLQRLDQNGPPDRESHGLRAEADAIARTIEQHLGTVRIVGSMR